MAIGSPELAFWRLLPPTREPARSKTKTLAPGVPCSPKRPEELASFDQRRKSDLGVGPSGCRGPCAASGHPNCFDDWRRRTLGSDGSGCGQGWYCDSDSPMENGRITLALGMHLIGEGETDSEKRARRSASKRIVYLDA